MIRFSNRPSLTFRPVVWGAFCFASACSQAGTDTAQPLASRATTTPGLHALIVGIDDYKQQPLKGAVNDARALERLARDLGVEDLHVLIDGAATRAAIGDAWNAIKAQSKPGDTILVSYSGHGSYRNLPEPTTTEPDGRDEFFLLGGYPQSPGEVVMDDEWAEMMAQVQDRTVVFVADACHSGSMTRGVGEPDLAYAVRSTDASTAPAPLKRPDKPIGDQPHVIRLSAVSDDKKVPEILFAGNHRGALSVAFERALRGEGDANRDGKVSIDELFAAIQNRVAILTDQGQQPVLNASRSRGTDLFRSLPYVPLPEPAYSVAIRNPAPVGGSVADLKIAELGAAEFVWDQRARTLYRAAEGGGQPVAVDVDDVDDVRGELARWKARTLLEQLPRSPGLTLSFTSAAAEPGRTTCSKTGGKCQSGDIVTLTAEVPAKSHARMVNLSSLGKVFLIAELRADSGICREAGCRETLREQTCVTAPFGVEHVYVVTSKEPLKLTGSLEKDVKIFDGLASSGAAVASVSLYSEQGKSECKF